MENGNDLIYRQAAIDAVNKACQEWRGIFDRCKDGLLALPSAQPEIIRCNDCKWSDWYDVDGYKYCYCIETGVSGRTADDFCSYAEREMDEQND